MAAKIKDGLFIGDAETSQSEIFINDNKISNLINLAGKDVQNIWQSHGLVYLTYNWEDRPDFRLFNSHEDSILTDIVEFIDVSIAHGISVLLFSKNGTGRCVVAACLYLMMKYRWGFEKSYDYVYSKKPDIDLNKGFIQQMFALDMKLLAARQKAYAMKHGIENGFRIEPNMTINDIAAMLPPNEAKRWNSWDPNYILSPMTNENIPDINANSNIEEVITWHKYSDHVVSALRKKDLLKGKPALVNGSTGSGKQPKVNVAQLDDTEEELVMLFSYVNSKNTISSLPGPYHNIYEQSKAFKLRFDNEIFEEDINLFPTSPPPSKFTVPPRGILKGGANRKLILSTPVGTSAVQSQTEVLHKIHHDGSSSTTVSLSSTIKGRDDKASSGVSSNASTGSQRKTGSLVSNTSQGTDELYKFVGVPPNNHVAPGKDLTSGSNGQNSLREEKKSGSSGSSTNFPPSVAAPSLPGHSQQQRFVEDESKSPMSAEDRLRRLMADMQKQNNLPDMPSMRGSTPTNSNFDDSAGKNSHSTYSTLPLSTSNVPSTTMSILSTSNANKNTGPMPSRPHSHAQSKDSHDDPYFASPRGEGTLSLYDLANMHLPPSSTTQASAKPVDDRMGSRPMSTPMPAAGTKPTTAKRSTANPDFSIEDLERDDNLHSNASNNPYGSGSGRGSINPPKQSATDPLAAFDGPSASGPTSSSGVRTSSSGGAGGAMRARHDILSSSAGGASYGQTPSANVRPGSSSTAASSGVRSGSAPRQAWGNTTTPQPSASTSGSRNGTPQRYSSPNVRQSASSNSSVNSVGSNTSSNNNMVGGGTSSSAKVYRHGSPAPNTSRTTSSRTAPVGAPSRNTANNNLSSNASVASNASVSTIGSVTGPSGPPNTSSARYGASSSGYNPPLSRTQTPTTPARYSSPMAGTSNNNTAPGMTRRGSNTSITSVGSNGSYAPPPQQSAVDPTKRRTVTGTSPMRASYSSNPGLGVTGNTVNPRASMQVPSNSGLASTTGSAGVSSRRFSTPTPQSAQHHTDYDQNAAKLAQQQQGQGSRPSTPTRAWKF